MKELNGKCYLYVIQAGEHFKIGISANPRKRMRMIDTELFVDVELKCAIPFDTRRDSEQEEASIQAELSEFHVKGEWFKLPYTSISNVIAAHGLVIDPNAHKMKSYPREEGKSRVYAMVLDEAYSILIKYKENGGLNSTGTALDELIKEYQKMTQSSGETSMKADRPHIEDLASMPDQMRELHRRAVALSNSLSELAADMELFQKNMRALVKVVQELV